MTNVYSSIKTYEGDDWQDFFERISIMDVFVDLIKKYAEDKALLKCIIRYIVMAYTKGSEHIHINADWHKNKKRIYEDSMLPPDEKVRDSVMHLQDQVVKDTIQKWLDYQDEPIFTQLQVCKELLIQMQNSAVDNIRKSSGETDFDQKMKNAKYVGDLRIMIKDLESELIQKDEVLKEAVRELKATKSRQTRTVANYI